MIKAIVTGGAGFIGSHITDELVQRRFEVHVVDDLSAGKKENVNPKAALHVCDVTDLGSIEPIFSGAQYVFHLAAVPRVPYSIEHPLETNKVNVEGTLCALIAAQKAGAKRFIYSASSSAYGDQEKMPLTEDMPASPKSPYGLHKYISELYCRLWSDIYGLPTVSLRYFNVYGPRIDPEGAYALVIGKFLKQRAAGEPMTITGDGEQTRDFTHVRDVVRANMLAMESSRVGTGEAINIGAGASKSMNELARLIGGPVTYIPPRLEPKHTLADNTRAKKLLGWAPEVPFKDGIAELKSIYGLA